MKAANCLIAVACLGLFGCATLQTLGPVAVVVVETRLTEQFLVKNPGSETKLNAVAVTLGTLVNSSDTTEITEAVIRAFVAKEATGWKLTLPEQELVTELLLAGRDAALAGVGGSIPLHLSDANVKPWVAAVQQGISAGIVQYHTDHPTV